MSITSSKVIEILNRIDDVMNENKQFLTDLDAAVGDGDHGINMSRGFNAVREKLKTNTINKIGDIFKVVGMTLVATVGGASGPLYGTAFMKAAVVVQNNEELDINDLLKVMEAALEGIMYRGKAQAGEKTMLDVIIPAINALKAGISENKKTVDILFDVKEAAKAGVEYTKTIIATKGRASYLGDRSISHQDPGATSSYLMLNVIYEEIKKLQ
ncbi:dihydroxyacetone kinase subunit L [Clostridium sp. PL3]|uniref:phosphoenolpyruvate--glycerone phosphotransferase n=1 Tax=Clostridium thailandense TaxID=2794346 RepID=A0A949TN02_9CLOT|nr:dihydroxyacetone kinase subunit DhaL [Clostridium thailandense]MBV7273437.1 dihydroxyacetone kinase subunit L [Clostridium thailandense]